MSDCILWEHGQHSKGYGVQRYGGRSEKTHRLAWMAYNGPIPEGKQVNHHCDVRLCINPEHLYLGTAQDNMDDMSRRGRARNAFTDATHCVNGHPFDEENTYVPPGTSYRQCRACKADRARRAV